MFSFVLLLILGILTVKITAKPSFCVSCHEMKAQTVNWQESGHSKQRCIDCHRLSSIQKAGMLFTHFSGISPAIENAPVICLNCHTEDRVVTPSGDLRIPHTTHLDRKVDCGSCHPAAGHVKEGSGTKEGTVVMAVCIKCHYQNQQTIGCRACHRKLPATVAHLKADWPLNHGKYAAQDLRGCNECHKYTLYLKSQSAASADEAQTLASPVIYARANEYCAQCHRQRPGSHNDYFAHDHAYWAYVRGDDSCLVCHGWDYQLPVEKMPSLFCNQCHIYRGWIPKPFGQMDKKQLMELQEFLDNNQQVN